MTANNIEKIREALLEFLSTGGSAANIARKAGLNEAYLSFARNNQVEKLKDEHWTKIGNALGVTWDNWQVVDTQNTRIVQTVLDDARNSSLFMAVAHNAGSGKSVACAQYTQASGGAVYLYQVPHSETNKVDFLRGLAQSLGIDTKSAGYLSANRLADIVIDFFVRRLHNKPLLIIDEADKLTDKALRFFISLYNAVEGRMGCVILGTENLEKKIKSGVNHNRNGFDEIDSRFGRRYIRLVGITKQECRAICKANGIDSPTLADQLFDECEPVVSAHNVRVLRDLRPLSRKITRELLKMAGQQAPSER